MVCGLVLAWGDKERREPYAWSKFPNTQARERYARYIAARYSAYHVYFLVSGEWHAEIRTPEGTSEEAIRQEFISLGNVLMSADPHGRMIGIHPMTSHGSVREFNSAAWMSFGDYQQNYDELHQRILLSRPHGKPVVNSEYAYYLRDQNGDGRPDKENSTSVGAIRHATWDIVMAGGYVVSGFGTTYFGGNRHPGPFDVHAASNKDWEAQIGHVKKLFLSLEWWKLQPADDLLACPKARSGDRQELGRVAPPERTYWCLADPGQTYVLYLRGLTEPVELKATLSGHGSFTAQEYNPVTGEFKPANLDLNSTPLRYRPPHRNDCVLVITRKK
jgi:hypothetical protein